MQVNQERKLININNMELTKLEQKIYNTFIEILPELTVKAKEMKVETRFIEFPFICEGCIDFVIYDRTLGKFTKIRYSKGIKNPLVIEGMSDYTGYFDKEDIKDFEIILG